MRARGHRRGFPNFTALLSRAAGFLSPLLKVSRTPSAASRRVMRPHQRGRTTRVGLFWSGWCWLAVCCVMIPLKGRYWRADRGKSWQSSRTGCVFLCVHLSGGVTAWLRPSGVRETRRPPHLLMFSQVMTAGFRFYTCQVCDKSKILADKAAECKFVCLAASAGWFDLNRDHLKLWENKANVSLLRPQRTRRTLSSTACFNLITEMCTERMGWFQNSVCFSHACSTM